MNFALATRTKSRKANEFGAAFGLTGLSLLFGRASPGFDFSVRSGKVRSGQVRQGLEISRAAKEWKRGEAQRQDKTEQQDENKVDGEDEAESKSRVCVWFGRFREEPRMATYSKKPYRNQRSSRTKNVQ